MNRIATDETVQDLQNELDEALKAARAIVSALENAESCETAADFNICIDDAHDAITETHEALKTLLAQAEVTS